jgi:hypothetical protein
MTAALSPVSPTSAAPAGAEWGDIAAAAAAAGAMKPAWTAFLKRKFYVPILRSPDDDPKNYLLHFERDAEGGHPTLVIAEVRERLDLERGDGTVALTGVDLLLRLDGQGAIDVTLDHGVFKISKKRADWLRSGIETTKARVVIRKLLQAAAPGGPFPVLRVNPNTQTVPPAAPRQRVREWVEYVVDARYFVPVTLSVTAIGMLWVLAAARQDEPVTVAAAPALQQAPSAVPAPAPVPHAAAPVAGMALHRFIPWDNSFSVSLPGPAEEVELPPDVVAPQDSLPANFYRLQADGVLYEMSAIHFGDRMPANVAEEFDHRQQLVVGSDQLLAANAIMLSGVAGREVRVRLADGSERVARYGFSGTRFFMLMVTAPAATAGSAHVSTVLQSFQLAR